LTFLHHQTRYVFNLCGWVQEAENGRALSEGTVLCSQDRIPIGRIEDTFGPVMCPLYSLRWAGQAEMPSSVAVDAPVFTTQKLAEYLLAEQLYTNVGHDLQFGNFVIVYPPLVHHHVAHCDCWHNECICVGHHAWLSSK